ncbi:hypothetical protein DRO66_11935 [Candidatus Bathyarchaeota archaeon]|nr:MAG: hypothetical protein DRO66_11935 [Candidatus Bathyarchaeota archaeon]
MYRRLLFDSDTLRASHREFCCSLENGDRDLFNKKLSGCSQCTKIYKRRALVLPEGDWDSKYVFMGIYPGEEDEMLGRPFHPSSQTGRLFETYLKELDIERHKIYLTNACFCRNMYGDPNKVEEVMTCQMWKLVERKKLVNAKYLFLLGQDALRQTMGFGRTNSIVTEQGKIHEYSFDGKPLTVIPLYHPGFVMRRPGLKGNTFTALRYVRDYIKRKEADELHENE